MPKIYTPSFFSGISKIVGKPITAADGTLTVVSNARDVEGTEYSIIDISQFKNYNVTVHNNGPAALADFTIEHSADGIEWEEVVNTFFDGLAADTNKSMENLDNVREYMRCRAAGQGGQASVRVTVLGKTKN